MLDLMMRIDHVRQARGFLTVEQTVLLCERGVIVMDPFSTLLSDRAILLPGIVLWPNVTIAVGDSGHVTIGSDTVLHSGVRIDAGGGSIRIGADGDIGKEDGFTLLAAGKNDVVRIGDGVRLNGGGDCPKGRYRAWRASAGPYPGPKLPAWRWRVLPRPGPG